MYFFNIHSSIFINNIFPPFPINNILRNKFITASRQFQHDQTTFIVRYFFWRQFSKFRTESYKGCSIVIVHKCTGFKEFPGFFINERSNLHFSMFPCEIQQGPFFFNFNQRHKLKAFLLPHTHHKGDLKYFQQDRQMTSR